MLKKRGISKLDIEGNTKPKRICISALEDMHISD